MSIRFVVLALAVLAVSACTSAEQAFEDSSLKSGPLTDDFDFLWDVTKDTIEKSGFMLDLEGTDHAARRVESKWKESLAPFRYQGKRHRVIAKVRPIDGDPEERLEVAIKVESQKNANQENPLESMVADWEDTEPEVLIAEQMLFHIRHKFREYGVEDGRGS